MMILIAAMSTDRVIGSGAGMPWDVPEEYRQYLAFVTGQTIVMGRRSYEIFGDDLTTDHTVVLTRSPDRVEPRGGGEITTAATLAEAALLAHSFGKKVFCGGGADVYEQALPIADAMYLSFIRGDFTGDAYFPGFDPADWLVAEQRDERRFRFVRYERSTGTQNGG